MPGLIGKKIGMTSLYGADGKNLPCTLLQVGPCVVTQVRTLEKDGYEAVQLGFGTRKEKNLSSAVKGHLKKAGISSVQKIAEFKDFAQTPALGDTLNVSLFAEGEFVIVEGTSKGKGFQGVVKRHGFGGVGGQTHGQHNRARHPGSIGACSTPSRVFKGMRMAGRTGGKNATMENLQVLRVLNDKNVLVIKGSVPGPKGSIVLIRK